jgi:hypothetical protein
MMNQEIRLIQMNADQIEWAQYMVENYHYLHTRVANISSIEGYLVELPALTCHQQESLPNPTFGSASLADYCVGLLLFNRLQATRRGDWYGSVEDAAFGICEVTHWQVLNLCRVWFSPLVQPGGSFHTPEWLPGFTDRKGVFRSTLVSDAVKLACGRIGYDYLMARPPVFPEQPYQLEWLLSYCDVNVHTGTVYSTSGFEKYGVPNRDGKQTWRVKLPGLPDEQRQKVLEQSFYSSRSRQLRGSQLQEESQLVLF